MYFSLSQLVRPSWIRAKGDLTVLNFNLAVIWRPFPVVHIPQIKFKTNELKKLRYIIHRKRDVRADLLSLSPSSERINEMQTIETLFHNLSYSDWFTFRAAFKWRDCNCYALWLVEKSRDIL